LRVKKMERVTSMLLLLLLVTLGVFVQSSQAIKCYQCEPCGPRWSWSIVTCYSGMAQACVTGVESGGAFTTDHGRFVRRQ